MKKGALTVIVILLLFPAISFYRGTETYGDSAGVTNDFVTSESIQPPEGIVSWWTGDGNAYDYVGGNHGTMDGDTTFAPGMVGEAFSFDGDGDAVWMAGAGIDYLQELSIECWVRHNEALGSEIDRYVTLTGEKAVLRHDHYNLHFYMSFIGDEFFTASNDLVVPDPGYNPFTAEPIDQSQFSFVTIEGLEPGRALYINAEFTNDDSDFMCWPADSDPTLRSYENNIAGNEFATGDVPESGVVWVPPNCDSIVVGCFDYDLQPGTWTLHAHHVQMKHIWESYTWSPTVFHHVAGTYDGSVMRLYMDGGLVDELFVGLTPVSSNGVEINSWGECLNGIIDEVSIYNHALSPEEILSIFQAGSAGKIKPEDDYHQYSKFYMQTGMLAGVGGYVEDYGDPDVWGDETQYLYCVGDMTGYKIKVWLTDYEDAHPGEDTLSPGWIEPHQHPYNPNATGPIEPRHFEIVSRVYLSFEGTDYTIGTHSDAFHVDDRGVFLGAWPYGIFRFDHDLNDPDGDGTMNDQAEQIAHPPDVVPDPNNIARTETLAYNPDENIWYAGGRCLGWEYRDIYQLADTNDDGSFLDEQWEIAFSYPSLNPTNPIEHHDGLEYAGGYLWISDMYSDRIAQWECVDGVWVERNILEYNVAAYVEGLGYGPNDHFWSASLVHHLGEEPHLYEFGGGIVQQELATPVYVDIKPASWPNPINTKDKGVLSVAICGTDEFDVTSIDPATITLGSYDSDGEVYPLRWSYGDVATPFLGELGGGHALDGDGYTDLILKFDSQEVIQTLSLALQAGEVVPLIVTGALFSPLGAHVRGLDYVSILDQQGIFGPPEFLRFIEGDLGAILDGYADLSSDYMAYTPSAISPYYPELFSPEEYQLGSCLRNGYGFVIINCDKYPLNITEFRRALAYAMDKNVTSSGVLEGHAQPHDSFIPIVNPLCVEGSLPFNYYRSDMTIANQLLDDAGFLDVDSDGVREAPDGSDFSIVVEAAIGSRIASDEGVIVAQTLQSLNIDAIEYLRPFSEYLYRVQNHEDYDIVFMGFNLGFDIRPIAELYLSSNKEVFAKNYPNFENQEFDFWYEQLISATEYEDVQTAAYELQKIFTYECPIIICYENFQYGAARKPLENVLVSPMQGSANFETFTNIEGIHPEFETIVSSVTWPGTLSPFRSAWWTGFRPAWWTGNTPHESFNPLTLVYEGLARIDSSGTLVPQLAKSWTIDYDTNGQFIDVAFRKDIMWHDGVAFSMEDIEFTMMYFRDNPVGPFAEPCSHADWIEIVSDRRVKIHLDYPSYWTVEGLLQVPILPEHVWMHIENPYQEWDELAIGTGPFALYEYYGDITFGDPDLNLAGYQLVTGNHPESGTIWTPEAGDYLFGVDFWSGTLPLDYSITLTYYGTVEVITGQMTSEDVIIEGQLPTNAYEIEKLHYVSLPAGVEVNIMVDWNTDADLDIYLWSPTTTYNEEIYEIVLQRWPPTYHMEIAYSIGHYYPAPVPYWFEPYHVLEKGTMLTIGWGMSAYASTEEEAELNLRNRIDTGTIVLTINDKALSDIESGYLWEYLSIGYDSGSGQFRAYVPYRYYLKAQPAGEYEIYFKMVDPFRGTIETIGTVTWVKG